MRANQEFVIVISWCFITAVAFGHDEKGIVILFHVPIREAAGATKLRPANLEPDQVVGVVNNAHLVRLRVAYAQERFVPLSEYGFWGWTCHLSLITSNSI